MKECSVKITDSFWSRYRELVRKEMIPYQWNVLNDTADISIERERNDDSIPNEKSHAIENFKIAAGITKGEHYGWVFQDSDVYKWLEAVAYSLRYHPDKDLQTLADGVVSLIAAAQEEDGYLDTYFTIKAPDRKFKRLQESHELYCAGHYMEAAVAYFHATGHREAIEVAEKLADCIDRNFGPEPGKIHGYDGHEEIEIGLEKLYQLTKKEKYIKLSQYFLEERGKDPDFFRKQIKENPGEVIVPGLDRFPDTYYQNNRPVKAQDTAEGHAVRLVYLCTAMAAVARDTGDLELFDACKRIWKNIISKRMYITGGIGSTVIGESFTLDYDLPNDTMYCETCASVGLVFFAQNMLELDPDGQYADVMERALYNTAIAGMALDGKHFFYVNPLEVDPKKDHIDPTKSHVKPVRPQWLGCACCPPNLARLIASLEQYIYTASKEGVLINLFVQSEMMAEDFSVTQTTKFPWEGDVEVKVVNSGSGNRRIGIRVPFWSETVNFNVDGKKASVKTEKGYSYFDIPEGEHLISVNLDMGIKKWKANLNVSEDIGKVAVSRGPFVYCAEEVDNGGKLHLVGISRGGKTKSVYEDTKLEGICELEMSGFRLKETKNSALYQKDEQVETEKCTVKMIPYYSWANRGENEMRVWLMER